MKRIVPLTPEKIAYANMRLARLKAKLHQLDLTEPRKSERAEMGKQYRSTRTAIKRWEDILAGRPVY
jgi:hypothetical protein